ncbi:MAG: SHOCT domain-containing protein [Phycisphaerales bacterium]|nr:SHOCT domain-containing protein [Phycisphaerales bacterium]
MNGQQMGVTPTNIELRRRDDTVISFQKDGYQTQSSVVTSCVSGWFAGNILLGGIIGGAVDLASGAAYRLVPENLSVTLSPLGPSERAAAPFAGKVTPELKLAQLELLKAQGQITPDEYAAQKKLLEEEKQRAAQPASTTG